MDREGARNVLSPFSMAMALLLHALLFLVVWFAGRPSETSGETVIPIDLLVVVNENPDGADDEPPPEREVPPEPPEPESPPETPPPLPPPEPVVQEAVVQEHVKTNVVKTVEEKPKPPEKTKEQIEAERKKALEDRLRSMRESATKVKPRDRPVPPAPPPRNNGRTEMRPKDWEKLLNAGYKPSAVNMGVDAGEDARCKLLIQKAFHDKWEIPAWNDQLREMHLSVQLGLGGAIKGYRLVQSSGDGSADASVLRAASQVKAVRGLSREFIENNRNVTVRFKVTPQ